MCGIAGFNYENKDLIKRMCDLMKHRGLIRENNVSYYGLKKRNKFVIL